MKLEASLTGPVQGPALRPPAFAYNALGIPLAALGYLSPLAAGGAMALSSVSVVGNALLPRRWRS